MEPKRVLRVYRPNRTSVASSSHWMSGRMWSMDFMHDTHCGKRGLQCAIHVVPAERVIRVWSN